MGECYWTGDISLWNRFHLRSDDYDCNCCCLRWRRYYIVWGNIWDPACHFIFSWNSMLRCHECSCKTKPFLRLHKSKVFLSDIPMQVKLILIQQWVPLWLLLFLFLYFPTGKGHQQQMRLPFSKIIQVGTTVSCKISDGLQLLMLGRWLGFHVGLYRSDVDLDRL